MAEYLNRTSICLNKSEHTTIDRVLKMYHTVHSARLVYKLMSTYSEHGKRSKMERFAKTIIVVKKFSKKLDLKSLRVF